MDLYEIRGGRLGVIAEEAEHQDFTAMETYNVCSSPSPTGAEDGSDDDDVCKEGETEVRTLTLIQHRI